MKKFVVTCFGLLMAIVAASPNCWAQEFKFDNGGGDLKFLTAANWNPDGVPDNTLLHQYGINDGFVVAYNTAVSTSVRSLIVGGDVPQTPGDFGTPGRLNVSTGTLKVTGGGDAFQIARACCNDLPSDVSVVDLSGDAVLEINGSDPIVGTRDAGQLLVRDTASVVSIRTGLDPTVYWRFGRYGASFDTGTILGGLQGDGLLDVSDMGSFKAHVIFLGEDDSTGELRVSDNGSVILTGNLVPRPSGFQAMGSASVRMTGSNATLDAFNLESESLPGEIPTQYTFNADGGGVSEIKLMDAVNINNNKLTVNLGSFVVLPGVPLTLFDALPNRIFGTFSMVTLTGGNSADAHLVYNQALGDIQVVVPEPSAILLLGLGMVMAICAKRVARRDNEQLFEHALESSLL